MALSPRILIYPGALAAPISNRRDSSGTACNLASLMLAIEAQDDYTKGHGRRVAAYAERIAQRLHLMDSEVETIRLGGLLHDIGKIAFSRSILTNRGSKLSDSMRAEIRRHPVIGGNFLRTIHVAEPVIDCVRFHHERLDGSGYPHALTASQIPLRAGIVGAADCFDALTTNRTYQRGRSPSDAIRILRGLIGEAFEINVVEALVEEVRENGLVVS